MANFIEEFKKGQKGGNKGLPMGEGLAHISKYINGIQQGMTYGIAAAPKAGKSTLVDYGFIIAPFIYAIENGIPIQFIYFSFEMDRISKEYEFATYFLYHDYGIEFITLEDGITFRGEKEVPLSSSYLRGKLQDDKEQIIKVKSIIHEKLMEVYEKRIVPLFGEFADNGTQLSKGYIDFIEQKENPTGLRNYLLSYARENGEFIEEKYINSAGENKKKLIGYISKDPNKFTIVVTDTIRKLTKERGFNMKDNIDKYLEYTTELRNFCKFTFVHIIHLNRSMADVNRIKFLGDLLYPGPDDIKDSGNLSEEANYIFTMFDPYEERYNLDKHFGHKIRDSYGNALYPKMRTLHLVESREVEAPKHFRTIMQGNIKNFKQLNIK